MIRAISAVRNKEMGYLLASKHFKVPKSTLEDYVKHTTKSADEVVSTKLGRRPALSKDVEMDLVNHCIEMDQRFYGLRSCDIRRLAFQ
ncbi:hypothetical protein Zmor_021732 [Zophobas morio]|uniref:HTH psq-type domain-containing protein n=1 Tax=Zophobas morio TaxID=2755281 RepID=A0AA38MB98_9CUCU|nr:hypothetical protein Zmor_021732 [Zophobas morio]